MPPPPQPPEIIARLKYYKRSWGGERPSIFFIRCSGNISGWVEEIAAAVFFRWANGRFWWLGWLVGWWSPSSLCAPAPPIEYQIRISLPSPLIFLEQRWPLFVPRRGSFNLQFFSPFYMTNLQYVFLKRFSLVSFSCMHSFLENLRGIYPAFLALDSRPNGQGGKSSLRFLLFSRIFFALRSL